MRDRLRRRATWPAPTDGAACAHTLWCDDVLVFCPRDIVARDREEVLREARGALARARDLDAIDLVVECTHLTAHDARRLWKESRWSHIRRGTQLLTSLPCSIRAVVVHVPNEPIASWDYAVRVVTRLLRPKLRARLLFERAGG